MSAVTVYGTHYTCVKLCSEHLAPCPAVSAARLYYFRSLSMVRSIVYIGIARRRRYDTQMEHEGTHSDCMYPTQTHTMDIRVIEALERPTAREMLQRNPYRIIF